MAEKEKPAEDKKPEDKKPDDKPDAKNSAKAKFFRVVHPHPGVHPSLGGEVFDGAELLTDDPKVAKRLTEYGCQVYEGDSQTHALGTGSDDEQARIERARQWAFQK